MEAKPHVPLKRQLTFSRLHGSSIRNRDSAVGIATGFGLDKRSRSSNPGTVKNSLFSTLPRSVLRPTQLPLQCVPGVTRPAVKLITLPQLLPRSRKHGSIHPSPHTSSWHTA
jgi:hypothetical protein